MKIIVKQKPIYYFVDGEYELDAEKLLVALRILWQVKGYLPKYRAVADHIDSSIIFYLREKGFTNESVGGMDLSNKIGEFQGELLKAVRGAKIQAFNEHDQD